MTELSVRQNVGMALLKSLSRFNVVNVAAERRLAERYVARLAIKTPSSIRRRFTSAAGTNSASSSPNGSPCNPKVLIVDEPTRGIDIGATADIHALLCDLAKQGMAILMISSDMAEILAMSDRILVMRQGRIEGELSREEATQDGIMHCATGQIVAAAQA